MFQKPNNLWEHIIIILLTCCYVYEKTVIENASFVLYSKLYISYSMYMW